MQPNRFPPPQEGYDLGGGSHGAYPLVVPVMSASPQVGYGLGGGSHCAHPLFVPMMSAPLLLSAGTHSSFTQHSAPLYDRQKVLAYFKNHAERFRYKDRLKRHLYPEKYWQYRDLIKQQLETFVKNHRSDEVCNTPFDNKHERITIEGLEILFYVSSQPSIGQVGLTPISEEQVLIQLTFMMVTVVIVDTQTNKPSFSVHFYRSTKTEYFHLVAGDGIAFQIHKSMIHNILQELSRLGNLQFYSSFLLR